MIVLAGQSNLAKGKILPVTVDAELEFDSVKHQPPPDTIEEEDEGQ